MPTTWDRSAGAVTNGLANDDCSAHVYSRDAESAVRVAAQSRPPWSSIHRTCCSIRNSVAMAGVL